MKNNETFQITVIILLSLIAFLSIYHTFQINKVRKLMRENIGIDMHNEQYVSKFDSIIVNQDSTFFYINGHRAGYTIKTGKK